MSAAQGNFFVEMYNYLDYADPRIENYFLIKPAYSFLFILTFYAAFIFKVGPAFMKNRKPMKLREMIMVYNWIQIILNATLLYYALQELPHLSIFCSPMNESNTPEAIRMMKLQYFYYLIKVMDLLDTIFFVLRKKYNQVSFLHVYHHILMAGSSWITCKFFIGGQLYYMGIPNLFVHVIMYFYYFLTAWKSEYKDNIWWKKYITQLQICQHCFIFTAFILPLMNPYCSYPKKLLAVFAVQAVLMIYLFTKFYINNYSKNPSSKKSSKKLSKN